MTRSLHIIAGTAQCAAWRSASGALRSRAVAMRYAGSRIVDVHVVNGHAPDEVLHRFDRWVGIVLPADGWIEAGQHVEIEVEVEVNSSESPFVEVESIELVTDRSYVNIPPD